MTSAGISARALSDVESIAARFADGAPGTGQPGVAWGVIAAGALVRCGGLGARRLGGPTPDADTVFRIASMTKSFTAATVLALRADGALALDDPVARYVPELDGAARACAAPERATSDSPELTIRHLLTMSGGMPTDDPWGDRQQDLPAADFARFLRGGMPFAWAPGTAFEYSNLGYAILGRVIAAAGGGEYADVVTTRLLRPLGLDSTVFRADDVPVEKLATGYRALDGVWAELPFDGYGAFAPMGGLFSTVRDLARWVSGFLDAFPARDDPDGAHPLRRAARREMQQQHRAIPPRLVSTSVDLPVTLRGGGYGFGLVAEHDPVHGAIISHSGGYPGFGSHMRWHPGSGLGVVVLANSTYAGAQTAGARMIEALLGGSTAGAPGLRPWSATCAAMDGVGRLVAGWDDELADRLFAMNVDLDESLERRRAELERLRDQIGSPLVADEESTPVHESPAHARWWLRGPRGRLKLEIKMSPQLPPRVQLLTAVAVREPQGALADAIGGIVAATGRMNPGWPAAVPIASSLDVTAAVRALQIGVVYAGACRVREVIACDGLGSATVRLAGPRADLDATIELDDAGAVRRFVLTHSAAAPWGV